MAMIGGGTGSFIGPVHLMAARMDSMIELVAGAFSSKTDISEKSGREYGLPVNRIYGNWEEMIEKESRLPADQKPDIICVVTPNNLHYAPVIKAINAGFHVICDKPLCISVEEALDIKSALESGNTLFCITHNYSGYPMVKKAREMVAGGELGTIRKVMVEYLQGWLSDKEEERGNKQAEWRSDPAKAGKAGCMGDIGTHAFQLAEYISGNRVKRLFSQLNTYVDGRILDDDGNVFLDFQNGIKGTLLASQVACGEENALSIRVYGTAGSLEWKQMEPNNLYFRKKDSALQVYRTASPYGSPGPIAEKHSRLPGGHPEGFIEAFANLYRNFALNIMALRNNEKHDSSYDYPGIADGLRGMKFLDAVVDSSEKDQWREI
ncbi:MAG: Gfo/Idh/MocA family oxidoreductase [Bacteroidales bacterium]|nr:Gfo/Idh/MocA family oxidoreductase [Bacteroidales bacterium]